MKILVQIREGIDHKKIYYTHNRYEEYFAKGTFRKLTEVFWWFKMFIFYFYEIRLCLKFSVNSKKNIKVNFEIARFIKNIIFFLVSQIKKIESFLDSGIPSWINILFLFYGFI